MRVHTITCINMHCALYHVMHVHKSRRSRQHTPLQKSCTALCVPTTDAKSKAITCYNCILEVTAGTDCLAVSLTAQLESAVSVHQQIA